MSETPRTEALVTRHQLELAALNPSAAPGAALLLAQRQAIELATLARDLELTLACWQDPPR